MTEYKGNVPDDVIPYSTLMELVERWVVRLGLGSYKFRVLYVPYIEPSYTSIGEQVEVRGTSRFVTGNEHEITVAGTDDFDGMRSTVVHELLHARLHPALDIFRHLDAGRYLQSHMFETLKRDYIYNEEYVVASLTDIFLKLEEYNDNDIRPKKEEDE